LYQPVFYINRRRIDQSWKVSSLWWLVGASFQSWSDHWLGKLQMSKWGQKKEKSERKSYMSNTRI